MTSILNLNLPSLSLDGLQVTEPATLGEYLFWLGGSLTPVIGGAATAVNLSAVSGGIELTSAASDGTLTLNTAPASLNLDNKSLVFAFTAKVPAAASVVFGFYEDALTSTGLQISSNASGLFSQNLQFFYDVDGEGVSSSTVVSSEVVNTDTKCVYIYNASTKRAAFSVNGSSFSYGTAVGAISGSASLSQLYVNAGTQKVNIKNIHVLSFSKLPDNLEALIAFYNSSSAEKLANWAV